MHAALRTVRLAALSLFALLPLGRAAPPGIDEWSDLVTLVCLDCHSGAGSRGGVDLEQALVDPPGAAELWARALRRVDDGEMPPGPKGHPEAAGLPGDEVVEFARGLLGRMAVDSSDPGRPTLRRLTRAQLAHVLLDLTGVDIDTERYLARDPAGYGFDTTGDTLFVSPLVVEHLYELVEAVLESAELEVPVEGASPADVRHHIGLFVTRAFRRPARANEIEVRAALYVGALAVGLDEGTAFAEVVRATLLAPSFLYRVEEDRGSSGAPWPVSQHELATRLSFFLWGTMPDDALRAEATGGAWARPGGLEATVNRMLASTRSSWLATDFAGQWLGFAELRDVTPDVRRFGAFKERLRQDLEDEAVAFFDDLIHADRSVLEVLDSRHAFLNRRLAQHYGIDGVEHGDIRRVAIDDRARGGVLGLGAVLTITSTPLRTSPVQRGQWVLERLLGSPAPPPPPDAGQLPEDDRQPDGQSLRARLEAHRAEPNCASCHARMDPFGLALEAFDGIGRPRRGGGEEPPIDTAVVLFDGRPVDGPAALKEALAARPDAFARTLAEALFTYAVGRPPALADRAAIQQVVQGAAREDYRFSAFVRGIVRSRAFTHRRSAR